MTIKPRITIIAIFAGALTLALVCTHAMAASQKPSTGPITLKAAIDSNDRSPENKARDKYRHPLQTLTFFGIKPNMTVVEVWPGEGWYTEILAPYLKAHGKLYEPIRTGQGAQHFKQMLAVKPVMYSNVTVTEHGPPETTRLAPAGVADLVLTFRNVHNWMREDFAPQMFTAMYIALKPGGILGVVEHRGDPSKPQDPKAASGYVREDYVIKLAEAAGFKLVGRSQINANPKDTKDYPDGVWTLPPTLKLKDKDRDKYLAIGESDRMTLKFMKPLNGGKGAQQPK
jgi:predicted methyltransferase